MRCNLSDPSGPMEAARRSPLPDDSARPRKRLGGASKTLRASKSNQAVAKERCVTAFLRLFSAIRLVKPQAEGEFPFALIGFLSSNSTLCRRSRSNCSVSTALAVLVGSPASTKILLQARLLCEGHPNCSVAAGRFASCNNTLAEK